jgi:hypothetical protein
VRPSTAVILVGLCVALLVDLAVLYLVLVFAPGAFEATLPEILRSAPDVGAIIPAMVLLALVWGPIRTGGLLLLALRGAPLRWSAGSAAG